MLRRLTQNAFFTFVRKNKFIFEVTASVSAAILFAFLCWMFGYWSITFTYVSAFLSGLSADLVVPRGVFYATLLTFVLVICYLSARIYYRVFKSVTQYYRFDRFYGVDWRWKLSGTELSDISELRPYCPLDQMQMVFSGPYNQVTLFCEHCGKTTGQVGMNWDEFRKRIERGIEKRIRTKEWKSWKKRTSERVEVSKKTLKEVLPDPQEANSSRY